MLGPEHLRSFLRERGVECEFVFLEPGQAKTSASAAAAVGCDVSMIAKNIVLSGRRKYVVVVSGDRRVDLEKFSSLVGERVRMAAPDEVLQHTGYAVGGVPPFAHLNTTTVYLDRSLMRFDHVYTSGGAHNVLLKIRVSDLAALAGNNWADVSR